MASKKIAAAGLLVTLAGCASMFTHISFSDKEIVGQAENMAFGATCVENGFTPGASYHAYGYAVSQLLSVSVYNKNLFEKTYKERKRLLSNYSPKSYKSKCKELTKFLPTGTKNVTNQYVRISRQRQSEISGLSQSASSFSSNMPTYSQQNISSTSNEVNFGSSSNQTNHYLVDFGQGQRMCMSMPSGYVRCQ